MIKRRVYMAGLLLCGLALFLPHEAKADSVFLTCTGSTSCSAGSVTQIATGPVNLDFVYQPNSTLTGDWEIAVLVPNGTATPTVGIAAEGSTTFTSGKLDSVLSSEENFGNNAYTFSSLQSASAQVGAAPNSFTVYDYDFGTHTSAGNGAPGVSGITVTAPVGSVIVGWVEVPGTDNLQTPLSGSVTVPEPPTAALLGIGLVALLLFVGAFRNRLDWTTSV